MRVGFVCASLLLAVWPARADGDSAELQVAAEERAALAARYRHLLQPEQDRRRALLRAGWSCTITSPGVAPVRAYGYQTYAALLRDGLVVCLSDRGGFQLSRGGPDQPYRVESAVTAREANANRPALDLFLNRTRLKRYHMPLFSDPSGGESFLDGMLLGFNGRVVIDEVTAGPAGTVIRYRHQSLRREADRADIVGTIITSGPPHHLPMSREQRLEPAGGGPIILTISDSFSYNEPVDILPVYALRELESRRPTGSGKPPLVFRTTFTDYAIERLPAERLRLAYYGLPNELVEDDDPDLTVVWVGLAVAGGVFVLVLGRRLFQGRIRAP